MEEKPRAENQQKISDLLFSESVHVINPLWNSIACNPGLFPALYTKLNNHSYIPKASFDASDFGTEPYDVKPYGFAYQFANPEQRPKVFIERYEPELFAGVEPVITNWFVFMKLTGFSISERGSGLPLAVVRVINDN
jgi:hypothetical protein